jgi:hypothetical protein
MAEVAPGPPTCRHPAVEPSGVPIREVAWEAGPPATSRAFLASLPQLDYLRPRLAGVGHARPKPPAYLLLERLPDWPRIGGAA